jgi:formylglycine-generating enzyme required for sulfatase activity
MRSKKQTHLVDYLDADWQRAVKNVRQAAARLWQRPAHRHAVDHGPEHTDRVIGLLDGLTEGLMSRSEQPLTGEEIYVLLAAAHLHAIGLQDEAHQPDADARWAHYPELGAEMIYRGLESPEDTPDLGLADDAGLVEMVALVVRGQRQTDYPSPEYDAFPVGNSTIRPRLLTALLCLADRLDLSYQRVILEQLKMMEVGPDEALDWWLHHYVSGVQVEDEYVRIGYRVPKASAAYEGLLPDLVEHELRAQFEALRDVFRRHGVKVDIASPAAVRPMRAVQAMPPAMWAAAEERLAQHKGIQPQAPALSPLIDTVHSLLETMGYDCERPARCAAGLTCLRCRPRGGGLRSSLVVGCSDATAEVAHVEAVACRLGSANEQGYVIAETRVLPSAKDAARATGRVRAFTLAELYNELLDFSGYVKRLVDGYEKSELAGYYVDLGCVRYSYDEQGQVVGKDRYKPMDRYVDAWLKERRSERERNHISILGDYGTGKTSFCQQYAAKQGRRWLDDRDRWRIPVLINLRDYTKTLEVDSLITSALVNEYGIREATFDAFMRYNADGKLLILFDGFDEMAQRTGVRTAVDNFWELAKVVVPGSKVLLTCRTPYFRTHHEAEALLRGHGDEAWPSQEAPDQEYINLRERPNFEIVYLEPFSDEDIQAVLRARFPDTWEAAWQRIQQIYNLPDLARRPVLLDMIVRTLSELQEGQTINAARLYQLYTDLWLEREMTRGRKLITSDERRLFAEELAMEMLRTGEMALHYSQIPSRVRDHFHLEQADEIDYFAADVRTCNFLNRDEAGNYAFVHKSFMEFFAACRLHGLMLQNRATADGPVPINEEVRLFLHDLFDLQPKPEPGPPHPPPEGFVWVPPGEFVLGGKNGLDVQIARLEGGFFAARTPVTNAQYAQFIEEGGYRQRVWWSEEGWSWRQKEGWERPRYWAESKYNAVQQPVVGVSWYEAEAYCKWLASTTGATCRLAAEEEWEKAARGYDGREYPWGEWAKGMCNTDEAGMGRPSAVGQFSPAGDSPYGLQDAAGNVWEWTTTAEGSYRVLRGGSFLLDRDYARCAFRLRSDPLYGLGYLGFRVVVSPISDASGL